MPYDPYQLKVDVDALTASPAWADEGTRRDFIRQVGIDAKGSLDTESHKQLMDTLWQKAEPSTLAKAGKFVGTAVEEVAKSVPAAGGAAAFAVSDALGLTDTGSGTRLMQGVKGLVDTAGQRIKQLDPNDRQEQRDALLESLREDLDTGAVPQGFERWLSGEYDNKDIDDPDTKAFVDALVSSVSRAGVAADRMGDIDSEKLNAFMQSDRNPARADSDASGGAGARQFLADYVATKDPQSWEAFKNRVTETDQQYESRMRTATAQRQEAEGALAAAPEGLAKDLITRSFSMQESPIDLASAAFPVLRGAKALQAARAGGMASALKDVGLGMAKEAGQEAGTEYLQDPRATAAQIAEAGALGAVGSGVIEGGMAGAGALMRPRDLVTPTTPEEEAIVQTVEGSVPAAVAEEALPVESAVEKVIASLESEIAAGTLTQKPGETGEAFIGRLNTQTEELAKSLETAAVQTVAANAELLPSTAAALAAEAPAPVEAPKETLDQVKARLRTKLSAEERTAMEERLKQVEEEGVLSDVFAEERKRATAREDAQRRLRELDAERARLEQDIAAQETPAPPSEPTPIVEEAVPPEQPVPTVEEAPAAQTKPTPEEAPDRLMDVPQAMQFLYGKGLTKTDREKAQKLIEKNEREARKTGKIQGARSFYESEIDAAVEEVLAQKQTSSEFRRTLEKARANKGASQELSALVDALDVAEATLKEIESDRGMFGVQWAEKNVRRRATMQKAKIRDLRERIVALAPSIKKAPTPPITEDKFPQTENVVAPAGETEVGLGMENTLPEPLRKKMALPYAAVSVTDLEIVPASAWSRRRDYLEGKARLNAQEKQELQKTNKQNWGTYHYDENARINEVGASLRAAIQDMQLARPDLEAEFRAKAATQAEGTGKSQAERGTTSEIRSATAESGRTGSELQRKPETLQRDSNKPETTATRTEVNKEQPVLLRSVQGLMVAEGETAITGLFQAGQSGLTDALARFRGESSAKGSTLEDITSALDRVLEEWGADKKYRDSARKKMVALEDRFYSSEETPPEQPVPAVEEAPAPSITEDKFPQTENVVAPAGEAGVGLGMEPTPVAQIKNAPKRINLAGAEFDVVAVNEDGTLRLSNDNGGEFDTQEGEPWTEVTPPSKTSASDVTKMSRADFIKKEIDAAVFAKKLAIQEAEQAIRNKWKPKKSIPVGVSKITAFLTKTRYTPDEKKLLHAYNFAQRMRGAEAVRDISETKGAVWDELNRKKNDNKAAPQDRGAGEQSPAVSSKGQIQPEGDKQNVEKESKKSQAEESGPTVASTAAQAPTPEPPPPVQRDVTKPLRGVKAIVASLGSNFPDPLGPVTKFVYDKAPSRDTDEPAQMTPEEFASNSPLSPSQEANEAFIKELVRLGKKEPSGLITVTGNQLQKAKTKTGAVSVENMDNAAGVVTPVLPGKQYIVQPREGYNRGFHRGELTAAIRSQKPVSAAAVDAYGITLPAGYVREGDLYVYRPEASQPAPAVQTAIFLAQQADPDNMGSLLGAIQQVQKSGYTGEEALTGAWSLYAASAENASIKNVGDFKRIVRPIEAAMRAATPAAQAPTPEPAPPAKPAAEVGGGVAGVPAEPDAFFNPPPLSETVPLPRSEKIKIGPAAQQGFKARVKVAADEVSQIRAGYDGVGRLMEVALERGGVDEAIAFREWLLRQKDLSPEARRALLDFALPREQADWLKPKEFGSTNTIAPTPEGERAARKRLSKAIRGKTNIGGMLDPSILKDAIAIGAFYLEGGARSFAEFSAKMIEEFGAGVQKYLRPAYDEIRKRTDIDTSGMDPEEGGETAPKAPEPETPAPQPAAPAEPPPPPAEPPPPVEPPPPAATKPAPLEGPVSVANEPSNVAREQRGQPRLESPLRGPEPWDETLAKAEATMAADDTVAPLLIAELIDNPRNISSEEVAILLLAKGRRQQAFNKAVQTFLDAPADQKDAARSVMNAAEKALNEADIANSQAGSEQGRSLNARKMELAQDYSFENLLRKKQAAKEGPLSEPEMKELKKQADEIKALTEQKEEIEASEAAKEQQMVAFNAALKEAIDASVQFSSELKAQKKAVAKTGKTTTGKTFKEYLKEKEEYFLKRINARKSNLNMNLNPLALADYAGLMATYIAQGVVSVADLTSKFVGLFGKDIEPQIPSIKEAADSIIAEEGSAASRADGEVKSYAEQFRDTEGEILSDRWVYNRVKEWLAEQDVAVLKDENNAEKLLNDAFAVITKEVNKFHPDVTERQLRDMFSGYGKPKTLNPDEAAKKLRQMRRLELLFGKLERAKAKVVPLRAGLQRDEPTTEERNVLRQLNDAMKDLDVGRAPSEQNVKTRVEAYVRRLKNRRDDLKKQAEEGEREVRVRKTLDLKDRADEVKALKAEIKKLDDKLDILDPPKPPTIEQQIKARLKNLDDQIKDLTEQRDTGKYADAPNKVPITEQIQVKVDTRNGLTKAIRDAKAKAAGVVPPLTQEEINDLVISNLESQIRIVQKQIDEKNVATKAKLEAEDTPFIRSLETKLKALREEKSQLKRDLGFGKKPKTDAELVAMAVKSATESVDELERRIRDLETEAKKRPSKTPETLELKLLRERRKELQNELRILRKAEEDAAKDLFLEQIKKDRKYLERQIKNYEKRLADGDFKPKTKKAKEYDKSLIDVIMKLDKVKFEVSKGIFEEKLKSRGTLAKAVDAWQQTLFTAKSFLTSLDLGGIFRQGNRLTFSNPVKAARNVLAMLKSFKSAEYYEREMQALKDRPNYRLYKQAKLFLAETESPMLSQHEDQFMSRYLEKVASNSTDPTWKKFATWSRNKVTGIPRASQRSHVMFLNKMRADVFDSLIASFKPGSEPTLEEAKSIATLVNNFSGRGDLGTGKVNNAANFLASVIFSPRMLVANLQALLLQPLWKADPRVRVLMAKEYARYAAGVTILYALVAAGQDDEEPAVELDPRSSDFLKIRFGDTRLDPLGGLIQMAVFLSRLAAGETKRGDKIEPLRNEYRIANLFREVPRTDKVKFGKQDMLDTIVRFARSKAAPNASAMTDLLTGKDIIGRDTDPTDVALRSVTPIAINDVVQALEAKGFPSGLIYATLSNIGIGTLHYNAQKKPGEEESIGMDKLVEIIDELFSK